MLQESVSQFQADDNFAARLTEADAIAQTVIRDASSKVNKIITIARPVCKKVQNGRKCLQPLASNVTAHSVIREFQ
jgi:hypothetical protein